jgi:Ni/Fe-hydrogenase subunit HybB-like protein
MEVALGNRRFTLDRHAPVLAARAVLAEIRAMPRALKLWLGFLLVLMGVGGLAALRALFPGDKGLGTTPQYEWGLLIVGYVMFAITTSGLCLASSLGTVFGIDRFRPLEKRHAVLALLCLVSAFGIIALDLHYPVRMVLGAVFFPSPNSPMWWMGVFYGIYLCFLLVEVWSLFWSHPRIHRWACVASSVTALVAPTTLGFVFAVMNARSYWNGLFTPALMLTSGFVAGTALLGVVFYAVVRLRLASWQRGRELALGGVRFLLIIGLLAAGTLVGRQLIVGLWSSEPQMVAATRALIEGPLMLQFVGIRLILGLALPLVVLLMPWPRRWAAGRLLTGSLFSLIGVAADRLTFVAADQIAPTWATSGVATEGYVGYSPSLVEIFIVVGAMALVAFLYTLAERYLDLHESEAHVSLLPDIDWRALLRRPTRLPDPAPQVDG